MEYNLLKYSVVIVLTIILFSCASLKRVQRKNEAEVVTVDNSISQQVKREVERQIASVSQVMVEYYPMEYCFDSLAIIPTEHRRKKLVEKKSVDSIYSQNSVLRNPPDLGRNQPIKRITTTKIEVKSDKESCTDSVGVNDIIQTKETIESEDTEEEPSDFTQSLKWVAISIGGILLIIIIRGVF
ncbi:MAG: hypothetical protein R3Y49_05610 [Rikenellaceae bacterium]